MLPSSDGSLLRKGHKHGTSLICGREERCHLWKRSITFLNWRGCVRLGEQSGIGTTCGNRSKLSSIPSLFTSAQLFAKCAISFTNSIFLSGPGYMKPLRRTQLHIHSQHLYVTSRLQPLLAPTQPISSTYTELIA